MIIEEKFDGKYIRKTMKDFINLINKEYNPKDEIFVVDSFLRKYPEWEHIATVEQLLLYLARKFDKNTLFTFAEKIKDGEKFREFSWGYIIPEKDKGDKNERDTG